MKIRSVGKIGTGNRGRVEHKFEPRVGASRKSFYGKATVIEDGDVKQLQSYSTIVAEYNTKTGEMKINGWYSNTTARHINEFLSQNGFNTLSKSEMEKQPVLKR